MKILVIHTGGTIGMVQTDQGFAPKPGVVEAALTDLRPSFPGTTLHIKTLAPLIDSAHATFSDWNRIAATIASEHDDHDGFVITHGTDTMAFTAAALCFALQGLHRPVVLTGSMIPLGLAGSDGYSNLAAAIDAAQTSAAGVWVQFAGRLLHGARVRKVHSQNPNAFEDSASGQAPLFPATSFRLAVFGCPQITIQTVSPGGCGKAIAAALLASDGAVLRVFGAGTIPNDPALKQGLLDAQTKGISIICVSQSPAGGVQLGAYAAGNTLVELGVIDGRDATPEAAYAKLAYVLGLPKHERHASLARNLCGEMADQCI